MRYEHNTNDYSLNMERGAGQLPPVVPPPGQQRKFTQQQNDDVDLFSGHGITETRFTDSLLVYRWLLLHDDNKRSLGFPHLSARITIPHSENRFRRFDHAIMLYRSGRNCHRSRRMSLMPTCFGCRSKDLIYSDRFPIHA